MARNQLVVLGDVVDSRSVADRTAFKRRLEAVTARLNDRHGDHLVADFTSLKGIDEVGGVLSSPAPLYDVRREFTESLHPERMRLACAYGEIDVDPDAAAVAEMDGEAFATADARLADVERAERTFELETGDAVLDTVVADQVNLIDLLKAGWSERQMEVVRTYRETWETGATAETLDVTPAAVSNVLRRTNARVVFPIEERLESFLAAAGERLEGANATADDSRGDRP